MTRMRASQLIASAKVIENVNHGLQMSPTGELPASERVVRPLTRLEPEEQKKVWSHVRYQSSLSAFVSSNAP
jgi:hypothetical protein